MNEFAAKDPSHRNFFRASQDKISAPGGKAPPQLVGVIADRAALEKALRLRARPDFFELRLDALVDFLEETERAIPRLHAPLICTARHPAEGGLGNLSVRQRRELLRRFLPHAAMIDVELRSVAPMEALIAEAKRAAVAVLISRHHLRDTPAAAVLRSELEEALALRPALFKLATRTDERPQLEMLLDFFRKNRDRLPLAAMGMGKLGRASRRQLLRLGSVLNYAALAAPNASGQPTLEELRRTRSAYVLE